MAELSDVQRAYFSWDPWEDPEYEPMLIGGGTIGGKGRSLLFAIKMLRESGDERLASVRLPRSRYIGIDVFQRFIEGIPHLDSLRASEDPDHIEQEFLKHDLPESVRHALATFLVDMRGPLAIRSSSMLEDSLKYSFAGKYMSPFIINGSAPIVERVAAAERQIKRVYARTYYPAAVAYRAKHGLGEDMMGITMMRISGRWRGDFYYPTTSGVAYSHNSRRWTTRIKREDGLVRMVFGLPTTATKRGYARTYSLTNPFLRPEGSDAYKVMKHAQEHFSVIARSTGELATVDIKEVWRDSFRWHPDFSTFASLYMYDEHNGYFGTLDRTSIFSPAEGKVCMPFETFPKAHKNFFTTMTTMLPLLEEKMGIYADVEFTYEPLEDRLELLQSRPLWIPSMEAAATPDDLDSRHAILRADRMITDGYREHIKHIIFIDPEAYASTNEFQAVARALAEMNDSVAPDRYILVAPGRVGSSNPKLGVPVRYDEIINAACIVEVGIPQTGHMPELSYGTHFFSDLETDEVLYMPVFAGEKNNIYDAEWFKSAPYTEGAHSAVRRYDGDFSVYMSGEQNFGLVVLN